MFRGSKFCPHCGAAASTPQIVPDKHCLCPHCQVDLQPLSLGGTALQECPRCGGLWISTDVFEHICADRETQAAVIVLKLPPPVLVNPRVRYLKCPQCARLMNRKQYSEGSGVILDICAEHGLWFDRGELRRIIEFIRGGGVERARQREIEELKRERQSLEADQDLLIDHDRAY
jgi:Zn-finger nucleic acid-binding protein